jgi:ureidoacrylate peracid hydrolase
MTDPKPQLEFRQTPVKIHRRTLRGLAEKIDPAHCALIVIDIQNDFCAPGGTVDREGGEIARVQTMLPTLKTLIDAARDAGIFVVFVRNAYSSEENWYLSDVWLEQASRRRSGEAFTKWDSCAPGSWQADFYDSIRPLPGEPVVTKHRYNAFHQTDLDLLLRSHGIRTIITSGISSNICVETTARDGFVRDYYVVFPSDATAAYTEQAHAGTLRTINSHFGQVVPAAEIMEVWSGRTKDLRAAE